MQIALVEDASQALSAEAKAFRRECEALDIEIFSFVHRAGLAGNWNRCLELSRGHLIHILHQDDRVRPQFYAATAAGFASQPDVGASFTQHVFISEEGTALRYGHLQMAQPGLLNDWLEYVIANLAIQCAAIVVRRSTYEHLGGFDTSYTYCLDRDMWQRIAAEYPLWYDPAPLAEYRVHGRSVTATLSGSLRPWSETRRCVRSAMGLISPPARVSTGRSARRHLVRLAITEVRKAMGERDGQTAAAALAGALTLGTFRDFVAVAQRRYDTAPKGRVPVRPSDRVGRRKLRTLVLTEFFPFNPEREVFGAFQRLKRHIEALAELGPVDVAFFVDGGALPAAETRVLAIKNMWKIEGSVRFIATATKRGALDWFTDAFWATRGAVGFLHTAASMATSGSHQVKDLSSCLRELQPDLVFAHRLGSAVPLLRARTALPPLVVDVDDIEHVKLERLAMSVKSPSAKCRALAESFLARHAERQVGKIATCLLASSELDRSKLGRVCRGAKIALVPNTASSFGTSLAARSAMAVFVGTAAYPPNREAILWLTSEIWPMIHRAVPDARLTIIGQDTDRLGVESTEIGIDCQGFESDLAPAYAQARLAVCPIRRGGGTRIKIIEAAMNAVPMVSTEIGAEGLAFEPDTEILIADTSVAFAEACVRLFCAPEIAEKMGQAARRRAEDLYSPAQVSERLRSLCVELVDSHASAYSRKNATPFPGLNRSK